MLKIKYSESIRMYICWVDKRIYIDSWGYTLPALHTSCLWTSEYNNITAHQSSPQREREGQREQWTYMGTVGGIGEGMQKRGSC